MKKWITYTIGILLTLVVLAAVGGAGYHMGLIRGASVGQSLKGQPPQFVHPQSFNNHMEPNFQAPWGPGRDGHGFEHRRGGMHFFFPLFGLVHLLIIGLLIWLGYILYKKSGWQFVRAVAPPASETTSEEKKPKRKSKS